MSSDAIKAVMVRWIDALKSGDLPLLDRLADELYTSDYTLHDPGLPNFGRGPDAVKAFVRGILSSNTGGELTIEDMIVEGDRLATRLNMMSSDPASGKKSNIIVLGFSRMEGDKIAEEWEVVGAPMEIPDPNNPIEVVKAFDAAMNAGDVEKALAFFSPDAYIKSPGDPVLSAGTHQIRKWLADQVNLIQVVSSNHRLMGDSVVWDGRLTGELVNRMGSSALDEIAEAVVRDGKIVSFSLIAVGATP